MTPEEEHVKNTYEELFDRWPLYKRLVHARVGLAEEMDEEEYQEFNSLIMADPEGLALVVRASLGLKGKPAGPELRAWMKENGILFGPLVDTDEKITALEQDLSSSSPEDRESKTKELRQLAAEKAAYSSMAKSRLNRSMFFLKELADQKE